ncbi:hypothetical protein QTP88_001511 [Uroleucon formosanum]
MPLCEFFGCNSGSKKVYLKNTRICFHRFPKDPKLRSIWQQQIQSHNNSKPINFNSGKFKSRIWEKSRLVVSYDQRKFWHTGKEQGKSFYTGKEPDKCFI